MDVFSLQTIEKNPNNKHSESKNSVKYYEILMQVMMTSRCHNYGIVRILHIYFQAQKNAISRGM